MMPHDVTQADREAAAEQVRPRDNGMGTTQAAIRAGRFDEHRLVQAFAAHRLAAIAEDRRGRTFSPTEIDKAVAEERAGVVAWLLSDSARLDYEASPEPREHFSWWAADAIERGDHIQEK